MDDFRVIVTGSRTWDRPDIIWQTLDHVYLTILPMVAPGAPMTLVHGACPKGADQIAHEWFEFGQENDRDVVEEPHPAEWETYGLGAGFKRNKQMVRGGAFLCLAFNRGGSRGTRHCASIAQRSGISVVRYTYPGE